MKSFTPSISPFFRIWSHVDASILAIHSKYSTESSRPKRRRSRRRDTSLSQPICLYSKCRLAGKKIDKQKHRLRSQSNSQYGRWMWRKRWKSPTEVEGQYHYRRQSVFSSLLFTYLLIICAHIWITIVRVAASRCRLRQSALKTRCSLPHVQCSRLSHKFTHSSSVTSQTRQRHNTQTRCDLFLSHQLCDDRATAAESIQNVFVARVQSTCRRFKSLLFVCPVLSVRFSHRSKLSTQIRDTRDLLFYYYLIDAAHSSH